MRAVLPVLAMLVFPALAVAADDISLDRAKVQIKDGNYADAIGTLSKLQELHGPAGEAVDRFELFMLKAEAQLQLGKTADAMSALGTAQKHGSAGQKGEALALEILVRKSPGMTFKPKTGDTDRSFNILKEAARKEAFAALFDDEYEPMNKRLATFRKAGDLSGLLEFSRGMVPLRAIETAATGKSAKSDEMSRVLRERLFVLVDGELSADEATLGTITANANKVISVPADFKDSRGRITRQNIQRRQGPTDAEIAKLKILVTDHEKLRAGMKELEPLISITPESLKTRHSRNDTFLTNVNTILTTDYTIPVQGKNLTPVTPKKPAGRGG